ncbi:HIT family protein [Aquibacillus sediminis]|uniref:HIT family protein n=1 Tax=Aquibacillus sediminis TaxID=2574734 RepID=UPI0011091245|nr:HIT family protein [Aquibacillus sediminis]
MSCPFCHTRNLTIELEDNLARAFFDKFPVQKGHLLIIPKQHVETYFDASSQQIADIHDLIKQGKQLIDEQFAPDGYNIGEYGGQTINHLHFHLIPRYKGDIEDPRGGVRKLVPYP